jgi:hypothetical protein
LDDPVTHFLITLELGLGFPHQSRNGSRMAPEQDAALNLARALGGIALAVSDW